MEQAPGCDCVPFDPFSLFQDGVAALQVDIDRGEVLQALVIAPVVVMIDEGDDQHASEGHFLQKAAIQMDEQAKPKNTKRNYDAGVNEFLDFCDHAYPDCPETDRYIVDDGKITKFVYYQCMRNKRSQGSKIGDGRRSHFDPIEYSRVIVGAKNRKPEDPLPDPQPCSLPFPGHRFCWYQSHP